MPLLTPAEALGLQGMRLSSRLRRAFYRIPEGRLAELQACVEAAAAERRLVYARDGVLETVRLLPCPLAALPDQIAYVHYVSLTIQNALKRLPGIYAEDPAVRELLRIPPEEEEWLWHCFGASHEESNPIFGRLDAVIDFTSAMWKDSLLFVEPNLSGIGGLHMVPSCEAILREIVLPELEAADPTLRLELGTDVRELLMQEVLDHLEAIGRRGQNVCFIDPKYAASGPEEQEEIARWLHDRYGLRAMHADPAELELRGEEVIYAGTPIDLAYRDYAVTELLRLSRAGADVEPMRALLRQNRVVSSIAAELDQKACFELLSDARLARRHFTADERQVFRRHVPWTRLVFPRRTTLPEGRSGDLLDHARRARESLVLKPNRAYGGEGVLLGCATQAGVWEAALERAVADPERWVLQKLVTLPVQEFPVRGPDGHLHPEPFYTVMGFVPSRYGVAVLGRASQKQVVNVAQRGGLCAVLLGHPPEDPASDA
jgi:hypothetical protein